MKNKFFVLYSIIISVFTIYVLLETFVIPSTGIKITDKTNTKKSENDNTGTYTDNSYEDNSISIKITTKELYNTTIYVADVVLKDINNLKTAFAYDTFGKNYKQNTSTIASNNNAILAINGDFYGFRNSGYVLRNGTIYRSSSNNSEDLVINNDGSFKIIDESSTSLNSLNNAYQVFSFGPSLINNNKITVDTSSEVSQSMTSNPRTAIGMIDDLHYIFVVSDGRTTESNGLSLYELATIMKDEGCTLAYNLDGGGSSTLWFNGKIINNPTSGHGISERSVSDIVYIGY